MNFNKLVEYLQVKLFMNKFLSFQITSFFVEFFIICNPHLNSIQRIHLIPLFLLSFKMELRETLTGLLQSLGNYAEMLYDEKEIVGVVIITMVTSILVYMHLRFLLLFILSN